MPQLQSPDLYRGCCVGSVCCQLSLLPACLAACSLPESAKQQQQLTLEGDMGAKERAGEGAPKAVTWNVNKEAEAKQRWRCA